MRADWRSCAPRPRRAQRAGGRLAAEHCQWLRPCCCPLRRLSGSRRPKLRDRGPGWVRLGRMEMNLGRKGTPISPSTWRAAKSPITGDAKRAARNLSLRRRRGDARCTTVGRCVLSVRCPPTRSPTWRWFGPVRARDVWRHVSAARLSRRSFRPRKGRKSSVNKGGRRGEGTGPLGGAADGAEDGGRVADPMGLAGAGLVRVGWGRRQKGGGGVEEGGVEGGVRPPRD
eukprot:1612073-Rhodomonas_salina.1